MTAEIQVLTGPASSGKTGRMLERYRAHLHDAADKLEIGRGLWLTPTHYSAAFIRENLLADDLAACFNPQVFTFSGFADRVLRDSPATVTPISRMLQRVLVRGIIEKLNADNALRHFSPIAVTTGFIDQVLAFISELKQAEIWPEHFEEVIATGNPHPRDAELAMIYRVYQQHLLAHELYDGEGRFWSARDQLTQGHWGMFADLDFVVVDGFSDFTKTQYEILQLLAGKVTEMFVTLPLESPLQRADLFAKPLGALQQLGQHTTVKRDKCDEIAKNCSAAFSQIAANLFQNPRDVVPCGSAPDVSVIEATGQQGEVRAIASQIKSLLAAGTSPMDIVVTFRSLTDYADLLHETFTNAGIPYICKSSESLATSPVIKALMAMLQVAAEDWPFERLLPLLQNNYFHPDWPEYAAGEATRDVAAQLRRLQLRGGRREILKRIFRAAQPSEIDELLSGSKLEKRRVQMQSAAAAGDFLTRLSAVLDPLQKQHTRSGWAEILVRIGREMRFDPRTLPALTDEGERDMRARDTDAWQAFENMLYAAAGFDERVHEGGQTIDFPRMLTELTDLIHQTELLNRDSAVGKVRVLDATQVRNLDIPILFVGGLTETGFPQRRGDDCFFSEADRRDFNERGLPLQHRTSRTQDEMLLFYGVVTRARQRLILSYPAMNSTGQPLLPSPYLLTLLHLFDEGAVPIMRRMELDPVPPISEMLTEADLRVVAVEQALNKDAGPLRSLFELPGHEPLVRNILAAATMADHRFRIHGFTPYEGLIPSAKHQILLGKRYSIAHEFSATELEAYANCPFQYFAGHILNVNMLDAPEVKTDYKQRGNVVHDVLKKLHQQYLAVSTENGDAPPSEEELSAQFDELLQTLLRQHADDPKLMQTLTEIETRLLSEWGEEYARQWADYSKASEKNWDEPPQPVRYEVGFGAAPGGDPATDAAETAECLVLGVAHRAVRIRGRIDRIDVGEIAGTPAFNVVDYKTGASTKFTPKKISEGGLIQLPLYAMAAERLGMVAAGAQPMELGYWFVKETGFKSKLTAGQVNEGEFTASEVWEHLQATLEESIPQMAAGIRRGQFPVYNEDTKCTTNCPFSTTCRVGQIRPLADTLHKTWKLSDQ
ncbi:DNA-dependent helicase II [Symmachiella dynata]|uniref:PD-(D/E)XK nuclease family protein n=1 Tax=Symmachiella dynata TaxID=2527995 RepID=UPI00118D5AE6|nr:PD-(D/E)XK nuclease family protein [Symmachiella dynata]QDT50859.1 DNA-dependent helicase II [Symmachiella dynata]